MFRPGPTLTLDNAPTVLAAGLCALSNGQQEIELTDLKVVDSAAVATLLAWMRAARQNGQSLVFTHFPPNLHSLATLYGVAELFPIDAPHADHEAARY